jgi:DNA-binding response OmpR family regulator
MAKTVLCVEDESSLDETTAALDGASTLDPVPATDVDTATETIRSQDIDALVTEYDFTDGNGLDVIDRLREEQPQTPAVLFTDVSPSEIDTGSFEEMVVEYLSKNLPTAHDQLVPVVTDIIEHSTQVGHLLPEDEDERLEALSQYDIGELSTADSFSRLTDLIASHFDTEIAFIGLVEEDQETFLACHGGDWDSLTREETICTHSMLEEDVMVVEDILADSRFSENGTLLSLGIRSYAGANMTTADGQVIGQVCLIDMEPREYSAEEQAELQQYADLAMEHLDLRQRVLDAGGADR